MVAAHRRRRKTLKTIDNDQLLMSRGGIDSFAISGTVSDALHCSKAAGHGSGAVSGPLFPRA
jgi:hypothetical protein